MRRARAANDEAGPRKAKASEQTRADIIAAAMHEFAEKGLAGARVDEIAERTATSKHMIYYHFGSKDGLYRAVLEHAYGSFRLAEESIDYDQLDPADALAAMAGKSFDFHVAAPEYVRIIMSENIASGEHIAAVAGLEQRRAVLTLIEQIVARGVAAGVFRPGIDPVQLHMTISALCFYYVSNRFTFGHIFNLDLTRPAEIKRRRASIVDDVMRICRA